MRETGKPTFVLSDYYWQARLRAHGSARSCGSRVVSTHGPNAQRMSAVQKVWSSYGYAAILLQHGPTASPNPSKQIVVHQRQSNRSIMWSECNCGSVPCDKGMRCNGDCDNH
jgi:hypothetical protein